MSTTASLGGIVRTPVPWALDNIQTYLDYTACHANKGRTEHPSDLDAQPSWTLVVTAGCRRP